MGHPTFVEGRTSLSALTHVRKLVELDFDVCIQGTKFILQHVQLKLKLNTLKLKLNTALDHKRVFSFYFLQVYNFCILILFIHISMQFILCLLFVYIINIYNYMHNSSLIVPIFWLHPFIMKENMHTNYLINFIFKREWSPNSVILSYFQTIQLILYFNQKVVWII